MRIHDETLRAAPPVPPGNVSPADERLVEAFEGLEIAAGTFGHRQHVQLTWTYLQRMPVEELLIRIRKNLKRFAAHHGAHDLYHETITWAFVLLIHDRMRRGSADGSFEAFRARCPELFEYRPSILDRYYSKTTLQSPLARNTFLWPDRAFTDA